MRNKRCAARSAGFTLLELLIAIAIFAIAGVAIMQATSNHNRTLVMIEDLTLAGFVAENELQLARLDDKWPPEARREGEAEMGNKQWAWVLESVETQDPNFRMLRIKVAPKDTPEQPVTVLQTFVGRQRDE